MSHAFGPILDALRGVRWRATERVAAHAPGAHRSRQRGLVGEFAEYRLYRQGDDPRTLDWKLLARSDRPFVRLADDRAQLPTVALLDASASMAFPTASMTSRSKWAMASALAVGLLAVARATGDPIGCLVAHDTIPLRMAPRTRRGMLEEIMHRLGALAPHGSSPLTPLIHEVPRGARLVVLTDALGDHDTLVAAVRGRIAEGGSALLVHLVAPEELALPAGVHQVEDPERQVEPRQITVASRRSYAEAFGAFRASVASAWRGMGASYALVTSESDPVRTVRALVADSASDHRSRRA